MKKLFPLLVLPLVLLSCGPRKGQIPSEGNSSKNRQGDGRLVACSSENHLDIAFYNVENLFDIYDDKRTSDNDFTPEGKLEWSQGRYEKKLKALSSVFQAMDHDQGLPSIIGLAEVENREVVEELGQWISPNGYAAIHKDSPDGRGIDVALLYQRNRIEPLEEDFLSIEFNDRGYRSRDILYLRCRVDKNEELHLFVNHWPSRREGQKESEHRRVSAAKTLKQKVNQVQSDYPDAKIVILGDFNDQPENKSLYHTLGARAENSGKKNELVNMAYGLQVNGKGTYNYKGEWDMLDQCIVSDALLDGNGISVCGEGLEIFKQDFILFYDRKAKEYRPNRTYGGTRYYGGFSDHLPIQLHLRTTE